MGRAERAALIGVPVALLVALGVAWAGSQGGALVLGIPAMVVAAGLAFLIQWVAFIPAYLLRTERFYDLTGSLTYVAVTVLAVLAAPAIDGRSILLLVLVLVWTLRLGAFLYLRTRGAGGDARFDAIKRSLPRFLQAWTLQGLWVTLTLSAALAAITTATRKPLGPVALAGALVWLVGWTCEVVADTQKARFRADPANRDRFIHTGLWALSRHPNYLGEIVLWTGVAIIALPVLRGWQWVTLVSPLFVAFLLTRVSGIPMLERRADAKWGGQADYEAYKARTPLLVPWPRFRHWR